MSNKGLLIAIAVILLGIFAVVLVDATQQSPTEQFVDGFGEVTEEISDEIDDNT